MKITSNLSSRGHKCASSILAMSATPDEADIKHNKAREAKRQGKLGSTEVSIALDPEWSGKAMHPDLYGLAAFLIFGPFSSKNFTLDKPVSATFADAVFKNFGKTIGPVDANIAPRQAPENARDGVSFSGGVDSCAALFLMPKSSIALFMRRAGPSRVHDAFYRDGAALETCKRVAQAGYDVRILESNLEFVRDPVGFPVDWANSAASVIHADQLGLRSISFGTIAESAFFLGHNHFSDLKSRPIYYRWASVFEAAGLPMCLPVAGLSEVVTSRIAIECVPEWSPQSCIRGKVGQPCMRCFKCFRKTLLEARITGRKIPLEHFDIAKKSKAVADKLLAQPIHHENGLAYSIHGQWDYDHDVYQALKLKTSPLYDYGQGLTFLERFYPGGYDYVPNFVRDEFKKKLQIYVKDMTAEDINIVENWNLDGLVDEDRYKKGQAALSAVVKTEFTLEERIWAKLNRIRSHQLSQSVSSAMHRLWK